jgi:hypothetical protein
VTARVDRDDARNPEVPDMLRRRPGRNHCSRRSVNVDGDTHARLGFVVVQQLGHAGNVLVCAWTREEAGERKNCGQRDERGRRSPVYVDPRMTKIPIVFCIGEVVNCSLFVVVGNTRTDADEPRRRTSSPFQGTTRSSSQRKREQGAPRRRSTLRTEKETRGQPTSR